MTKSDTSGAGAVATENAGTEWWTELKSIRLHVEGDTPPMWPAEAGEEYRAARLALVEAELALRDQVEAVAAQRSPSSPRRRSTSCAAGVGRAAGRGCAWCPGSTRR